MTETGQDGIWIIDHQARTVYASVRMAEILGASDQAIKGEPSFAFLFPEDVDAAQKLFDQKKDGDPSPFHFRLRRQDGSPIWVAVRATPIHSAAGEFKGIVGVFSQIPPPIRG